MDISVVYFLCIASSSMLSVAFILFFLSISFGEKYNGRIPTRVCEMTSLLDLVDLQTKVNYERIMCEAGQFEVGECARYYMLDVELVKRKLSFSACGNEKRGIFHAWMGTSFVNGTVQSDYFATMLDELHEYNLTSNLLISNHNDMLSNLAMRTITAENLIAFLENATRSLLSQVASDARVLYHNVSQDNRNLVITEAIASRQFYSSEEDNTRDTVESLENSNSVLIENTEQDLRSSIKAEESTTSALITQDALSTRSYIEDTETGSRELVVTEATQTRSHFVLEDNTTRDYNSDSELITVNVITENHMQIRALASTESSAIISFVEHENEKTFISWKETAQNSQDLLTSISIQNRDSANVVVGMVSDLNQQTVVSTFTDNVRDFIKQEQVTQVDIGTVLRLETQPTLNTINDQLEVINLTQSVDNQTQTEYSYKSSSLQFAYSAASSNILASIISLQFGVSPEAVNEIALHSTIMCTAQNSIVCVEDYARPQKINELVSLVNATLAYNLGEYGNTINSGFARDNWNYAERYRRMSPPDYIRAVLYYSYAYKFAVYPYVSIFGYSTD